jgi:hypothetical protein
MKTLAIESSPMGNAVSIELTELELTALVALVEQGRKNMGKREARFFMHQRFDAIAEEFGCLLAHFELLAAND